MSGPSSNWLVISTNNILLVGGIVIANKKVKGKLTLLSSSFFTILHDWNLWFLPRRKWRPHVHNEKPCLANLIQTLFKRNSFQCHGDLAGLLAFLFMILKFKRPSSLSSFHFMVIHKQIKRIVPYSTYACPRLNLIHTWWLRQIEKHARPDICHETMNNKYLCVHFA